MWLKSKKNRGYTGATTTRFCIGSLKSANIVGNIKKTANTLQRSERNLEADEKGLHFLG